MRQRWRGARAVVAGALVAVAALASPGSASAHFESSVYSFNSSCSTAVDPVTVIFFRYAYIDRVRNHIQAHLGWGETTIESEQYFREHGGCSIQEAARASANSLSSRYHIRINRNADGDSNVGMTSEGTPHWEDIVWCGWRWKHAVRETTNGWSGYDMGRRRVHEGMSAGGHYSDAVYWGNTAHFRQCDGGVAWSNGYVRWIGIPSWFH